MANIQISEELFAALCKLFLDCPAQDDDISELERYIGTEIASKLDKVIRRHLYTKFKTEPSEAAREAARRAYLDAAGIPETFRW